MTALAPHWGGSPAQVRLLCKRYAAKITSVPGDDSQVCEIDAVYSTASGPVTSATKRINCRR